MIYSEEQLQTRKRIFLQQSDWTQLPDVPLTDEQKAAWATYRQALRDFNIYDPNAVFPTPPVFPAE
jgi:hypothetical protein